MEWDLAGSDGGKVFRITPLSPVKIIPTDSRISQSVAYRRTLKIPGKKTQPLFLVHLQSGSNTALKNTWYSPIGICRWRCCSHIQSAWRKGCVLGLNRLVSLGTSAWMPLFSMWMTHQCVLLALVVGAKKQWEGQWRDHSKAIVFALNMYQWNIMLHEVAVNSIRKGDVLLSLDKTQKSSEK